MAAGGLLPDMVTYVTAVRALCGAVRLAAARGLAARLSAHGCAPNTVVQSALIDGACACGDLDCWIGWGSTWPFGRQRTSGNRFGHPDPTRYDTDGRRSRFSLSLLNSSSIVVSRSSRRWRRTRTRCWSTSSSLRSSTTTTPPQPPIRKRRTPKRARVAESEEGSSSSQHNHNQKQKQLSRIPPELFHHILKLLSSERDQEDMVEFVRNTPTEFREYYIQMQAAKRSQAPLPSQVDDDRVILDRTVADQVSIWKTSRGLSDEAVAGHVYSGKTCSYSQIGGVFLCERTGHVHVCDESCRELVLDVSSGNLVCTISGHCFDRWLSPVEESYTKDTDQDHQEVGVPDEVEPFMGSGRFARAYLLGYDCADEKEPKAALRFC